MNLTYAPFVDRIGWMLVHSIWLLAIPASSNGAEDVSGANTSTDQIHSNGGRVNFDSGYFVELAGIGDLTQPNADTVPTSVWSTTGSLIEAPFYGVQIRPGLTIAEDQNARKFYVRARMPKGTEVKLDVAGRIANGSTAQSTEDSTNSEVSASAIAVLPADQKTVDVTVNLQLPAWRTLASFDFAGGVKNGIIMDWERKVSDFSRYAATGDFGPDATKENVRIIAFDRQHRQLGVAETSSKENKEGLTELKVAFKNSDGRPGYIVVQRRVATHPIVFRNVPLSPGKSSAVEIEIAGVVDEATSPSAEDSSPRPLRDLLAEPIGPLSAQLPGAGTIVLRSIREADSKSPGWHADGSPRLTPFRDEQLSLMRPSTDDDHRKLEALFEFVASSPDVRIGRIRIRPDDGSGSTTRKPFQDEENDVPGVRLLQALNILDDRETEDFEVDVFAGPASKLASLPIVDPPRDYEVGQSFGYKPDPSLKDVTFYIKDPVETKIGWRHTVMLVLSDEAPEGAVLTAITDADDRIDGFTHWNRDRVLLGTFDLPSEEKMRSVEIATQPRHSMVFRNVSVWSGLGSSAFVDQSEPAAIDFESIVPSRIFLRTSGERIAEQDGEGVGVSSALQALNEIERRGGLFRFDRQAEAPSGETLPYLTEIRWRDFRADELQWLRALAGLTRLDLSSEHTTDASLRSIEHLTTLTKLELSRSRYLTTNCLMSIGKLTELRELQLYGRSLKWSDADYNAEDFKQLRNLTKIVEWEPYDWRMDDAGIAWLENADDLYMVYGWGPEVTDRGFAALADKPNLGVIYLGTTKITDASLKLLERHPKLYWLQCSSPNLTDTAIDSVITMSNLREVHLFESRVTDAGVQKLIDAIEQLPRLETVNLTGTPVSQEMVQKLRAAREGLRVLASEPTVKEKTDHLDAEQSDSPLSAAVPHDVPWPDKKWTQSLPPSGSGIRVKLDERRWVEFNSVYATRKIDNERSQIRWKADGELIDPPADFDPKSLVPDRDGGEMPSVTRGFLMQVVGPEGTQIALDTSGGGGHSKTAYPLEGRFVQIPLNTIASSIGYNHAYAEVKVSQEVKEVISPEDSQFQILSDLDARKIFVVTKNAREFAWQLMIDRDGKVVGVEPYLVGGQTKSWVPDELKPSLKDEFKEAQVLGFSFAKDQPMPTLVSLERSPYDIVRFENLSVYPGPRTAVVVSVNGVPIDEGNRPEIDSSGEVDLEEPTRDTIDDEEFETVTLTGTVVDENGVGINGCWVGLFIQPQEYHGQSARSPNWAEQPLSAFADGPPLALETQTDALGQFTFEAPKTHFVFEGQFWAMRPDGTLGTKWLNAVWSHVQRSENLKITITDDEATVRVLDPNGNPLADADVTLQAYRVPRSVTHRLPVSVQQRITSRTDDSGEVTFGGMVTAAVRGVAVSTEGFGTQFLSDRLASVWVGDGEPLTLKLQPTASLAGQIIDFDPQRDKGLQLQARTEQHDDRPPMYGRATANVAADGAFRFDHLAAGWVSLESSLPPESDRKVRFAHIPLLEAGEDRVLDAAQFPRMVPAVVVRQRLIKSDTGEGIPNSRLRVLWGDAAEGGSWRQSQALTTDADGWWMARVAPGTINIRLGTLPDGYRSTTWFDGRNGRGGVKATVPATDKLVTLPPERYAPAVELTGRLQHADGTPAAKWSIYGHPISWDDVGVGGVQSKQNGSFTLTHPVGYPPRFFNTSNRQWMTEHDFTDRYVVPEVISKVPLVLQIPDPKSQHGSSADEDTTQPQSSN